MRGDLFRAVPDTAVVHTFNLAGYQAGHAQTARNRHVIGGLSDKAFGMIATLEATRSGSWPWEQTSVR